MQRHVAIALGVLAVVGGAVAVLAQDRPAAQPADPTAKARVDLASEAYRRLLQKSADLEVAPPGGDRDFLDVARAEQFYRWSRRWMEARCDQDSAVREAAIKEHRDRMKSLEEGEVTKSALRGAGIPVDDKEAAESLKMLEEGALEAETKPSLRDFIRAMRFFRLEAESWLARGGVPGPG